MNQKSSQNSLGLDLCFEDEENPVNLFRKWFAVAEKAKLTIQTPSLLQPQLKTAFLVSEWFLLKGLSDKGFVFYTNFNSKKGSDLSKNPNASICFHWKSLRRQVRVSGKVVVVEKDEADNYFKSRKYGSKISAWASSQSQQMKNRDDFLKKIKEYEKKYPEKDSVPRPPHWSGWRVLPNEIEFWLEIDNRSHQRLLYKKQDKKNWIRQILLSLKRPIKTKTC